MKLEREALSIAMALSPSVYSRNRYFALYTDVDVRAAKARALTIRSVVRQLKGEKGPVDTVALFRHEGASELHYRIGCIGLERRVRLTDTELACVRYMLARAQVHCLPDDVAEQDDRAVIDSVIRRSAIGLDLNDMESKSQST